MCHPEAKPKDLACEGEILRCAQNDSNAVSFENLNIRISDLFRISIFEFRIFNKFTFLFLRLSEAS